MDRVVGGRKGSWTAPALAAALALGASTAPANAQTSSYSIIELAGVPQRINNNGQVAGWVYVGPDAHAAIYSNGAWRDLGVPAGDQLSTLFGINNAGAAVGFSFASLDGGADNRWQAIQAAGGCHVGPGPEPCSRRTRSRTPSTTAEPSWAASTATTTSSPTRTAPSCTRTAA